MPARIVGVMGGAGSPGASTVASQLAVALSRQPHRLIYLMDWDEDGCCLPARWGAEDTGSLSSLYAMAKFGDLSEEVMQQASQQLKEQLWLVTGFRGLDRAVDFDVEAAWRVLSNFAAHSDVLVLDCGRLRADQGITILQRLDYVIWVVQPTAEGALTWRKTWEIADFLRVPTARAGAVINQSNHPQALRDFPSDWRAKYSLPIVARVPFFKGVTPEMLIKPDVMHRIISKSISGAYTNLVGEILGTGSDYKEVEENTPVKKFSLRRRPK